MIRSLKFIILVGLLWGCSHSVKNDPSLEKFNTIVADFHAGSISKAMAASESLCEVNEQHAACFLLGKDLPWKANFAIMQGASSRTSVQMSVVTGHRQRLNYFAFSTDKKNLLKPAHQSFHTRGSSKKAVVNLSFSGLTPEKTYYLLVVDHHGTLVDWRQFQSLQASGSEFQFALLSCMRDDLNGTDRIWSAVDDQNMQALFMIGDNVYIDHGLGRYSKKVTPDLIWQRHLQTRGSLKIFRAKRLTPVFAVWDDHDYGQGNGDHQFVYKKESMEIFGYFFPMATMPDFLNAGPGLARSFTVAGQQFILLDDRSFRVNKADATVASHFGVEQTQWMLKQIESFAGVSWLISGDQFFGGYQPFDSFQGNHPKDFKNFMARLRATKRAVIFASGDRHMSELQRIPNDYLGYKTYEVTSSPVHSSVYPGALSKHPNPYRIAGLDGEWNFITVVSSFSKKNLKLKVKSLDQNSDLKFSESLVLKSLVQ